MNATPFEGQGAGTRNDTIGSSAVLAAIVVSALCGIFVIDTETTLDASLRIPVHVEVTDHA